MGGWIELTDKGFIADSRKKDGPILCQGVTSWGMLASPTASEKDFYWESAKNTPTHSVVTQSTYHFFCHKIVTNDSPTVLLCKLFPDPEYNPLGFPVIAPADMTAGETFAEWRMDAFFGTSGDSQIVLHRIPIPDIWFHGLPPIAPVLTPWRVIYNIIKYGWQP